MFKGSPTNIIRFMEQKPRLDRTDCEILAELQKNARLSNKELAARIGLAPSSCLERVRRLASAGVLRGYHAQVDPGALGIGLEAMVADLDPFEPTRPRRRRRSEVHHRRAPRVAAGEQVVLPHRVVEEAHAAREARVDEPPHGLAA